MKFKKLFITLLTIILLFTVSGIKQISADGTNGNYSWTITPETGTYENAYTIRIFFNSVLQKTIYHFICADAKNQVIQLDAEAPKALKLACQETLNESASTTDSNGNLSDKSSKNTVSS